MALHILHRGQLTESWYREGVATLESLADKDSRYPKILHGASGSSSAPKADDKGAELSANLGGSFSAAHWSHNPLGISAEQLRQSPPGHSDQLRSEHLGAVGLENSRKRHEVSAAQSRAEAFSLTEVRLQADGKLRQLNAKAAEIEELLSRQARKRVGRIRG